MMMLVLAGGFGTRLRGVVADLPKPLAPIGSTPFLHYQIEHWIAQGVQSFVFLLHYQSDLICRFINERQDSIFSGCLVKTVVEPEPLDTGGAVAYAVKQLGLEGRFMVANADTWVGCGIREIGTANTDSMTVLWHDDVSRYGQVELDDKGSIRAFQEKGGRMRPGWINAGLYNLRADIFSQWDGQSLSLEKCVLPKLLAAHRLSAVPLESDFIDIGVPEDYLRFCRWQERGREGGLWS